MTEIVDLPEETLFEDADWLIMYKPSAGSNKSRKVPRNVALKGATIESNLAKLTSPASATLINFKHLAHVFAVPDVLAASSQTVVVSFAALQVSDQLIVSFTSFLPDGLHAQAIVTGANQASIKFYNSTGATITGASYTAILTALTFE